jgi:hypothetical protein
MVNYNSVACVKAEGLESILPEAPEKERSLNPSFHSTRQESFIGPGRYLNPANGIAYCTVDLPKGPTGWPDPQADGRIIHLQRKSDRLLYPHQSIHQRPLPGLYVVQVNRGFIRGGGLVVQ